MDLPISNSLPSSLALIKSPTGLGISGSGSFQSHLSTGKSHQRLRIGVQSSKELSLTQLSNPANAFNSASARQTSKAANYLVVDVAVESSPSRLVSWPKFWFQWVAFMYCCLSVIVLSATIIGHSMHDNIFFHSRAQGSFIILTNSNDTIDLKLR